MNVTITIVAIKCKCMLGRKEYYFRLYMDRSQNLFSFSFEEATLHWDNIIQQKVKRKFGNESLFF